MPSTQFLNLAPQAQERIRRESLREFAGCGYDLASTNRIVEAIGISKGVLFKYFTDKESLFLYVADHAVRMYSRALPQGMEGDIFDWLREATAYKLRFIHEEPLVYRLALRILKEPQHPVYAKALACQGQIQMQEAVTHRLLALVPVERLRPGVAPEDVLQLLTWIATGIADRFLASFPDGVGDDFDAVYQALTVEFDRYLTILKDGVLGREVGV
jgi:AcrR family transcriptional regulator